jgi:two-component sensor histidine kinase
MTPGMPFAEVEDGRALAQAIVDTVREPLLVLDQDLRVVAASRSFYLTFQVDRQETHGRLLYALGDGQWDIPALRELLEKIVPDHGVLEGYEVEHEFPRIGQRNMLLNARKVFYEGNNHSTLLLAIEDITERRAAEQELQRLLHQKELLLEEMQHRIANSLQIIASILLLKASTVQSEETRQHLQDAHKRVMSVASVQQHLRAAGHGEQIEVTPYLSKLCETLAQSMIGDSRPITIEVVGNGDTVSSSDAVSIGLIVTEGVLNALKHAFPEDKKDGRIVVTYEVAGSNWTLSIADNGIGKTQGGSAPSKAGLGTSIVNVPGGRCRAIPSPPSLASGYGDPSLRHRPNRLHIAREGASCRAMACQDFVSMVGALRVSSIRAASPQGQALPRLCRRRWRSWS